MTQTRFRRGSTSALTLVSAGSEMNGYGEDRIWPVGSRPANTNGLYDMHGNAGEWTGNWNVLDVSSAHYAQGNASYGSIGFRCAYDPKGSGS